MLVELGLVEQRLKAVHAVLDGAPVVDVADRFGVTRQTVHVWLKNYATAGRRARAATVGSPVTRLVDSRGGVSFAGTAYQDGHPYRGQTVQVAIVAGNVQLAIDGKVIKTHPIRHDPIKEHGAFANPGGRPPKKRPA